MGWDEGSPATLSVILGAGVAAGVVASEDKAGVGGACLAAVWDEPSCSVVTEGAAAEVVGDLFCAV